MFPEFAPDQIRNAIIKLSKSTPPKLFLNRIRTTIIEAKSASRSTVLILTDILLYITNRVDGDDDGDGKMSRWRLIKSSEFLVGEKGDL
jgi:hypothetical protein